MDLIYFKDLTRVKNRMIPICKKNEFYDPSNHFFTAKKTHLLLKTCSHSTGYTTPIYLKNSILTQIS